MKFQLLIALLLLAKINLLAQKPPIDTSIFNKWPSVEGAAICNDGNYVLYIINNQPVTSTTLVIQSLIDNWRLELPYVTNGEFLPDSRIVFFFKSNDSLGIATLGGNVEYKTNVRSYKFSKHGGWYAYVKSTEEKELTLKNLTNDQIKIFPYVSDYFFSDDGRILLLNVESKRDNVVTQIVKCVDLVNNHIYTIWEGIHAYNFVFDGACTQVAFLSKNELNKDDEIFISHYKIGDTGTTALKNIQITPENKSLSIEYIQDFSRDGKGLYINMKSKKEYILQPDGVNVDVWSYKDPKLQSQQLKEVGLKRFWAFVDFEKGDMKVVTNEDDQIVYSSLKNANPEDVVLISNSKGDGTDINWNPSAIRTFYLATFKNGIKRQVLKMEGYPSLSPKRKFLIYYDPKLKTYFSYNISSKITCGITNKIGAIWTIYGNDYPNMSLSNYGIAGWLQDDLGVFLYDQNDIWLVDPAGKKPPVNITNGLGRKRNIVFRFATYQAHDTIFQNEALILTAYNRNSKNNGYYSKWLNKVGDPILLNMGAFCYDIPDIYKSYPIIKAKNSKTYIVKRESATESPNYFVTTDFKTYKGISAVFPEKSFNWYTTELHTWKTLDGGSIQGVLFKPENFDSGKKYPVIFYYYERLSDELNIYQVPEASTGPLNIPYFVSNGYIVFTPDIRYKLGETGKSVVNCVVSAVNYLSKFPWVDKSRMGIQGHSFGGYETNYLVSNTTIFAAACSAAGVSDCISHYGTIRENGIVNKWSFEIGIHRIGSTLWQRPDLYIKNSPIFRADKVLTPLLIMHNKDDQAISFSQGIEFFTALRRLGKTVWMLQYDGERHNLTSKRAANDYTIRLAQYFDHYLKEMPAPKWMTCGISAAMKGIYAGYELDPAGYCGSKDNKCKICNKWNLQYRRTPEMFSKSLDKWYLEENTAQKQNQLLKAVKSNE